jgi:hypothetical protein
MDTAINRSSSLNIIGYRYQQLFLANINRYCYCPLVLSLNIIGYHYQFLAKNYRIPPEAARSSLNIIGYHYQQLFLGIH